MMLKSVLIVVTLSFWVSPVEAGRLKFSETVQAWNDFQDTTKTREVRQKAADDFVDCLQGERGWLNSNIYHLKIRNMRKQGENKLNTRITKGSRILLTDTDEAKLKEIEGAVQSLLSHNALKENSDVRTLGQIRSMITDPWQDLNLCPFTMDESWNDPYLLIPLNIEGVCRIKPGIFSFGDNVSSSWFWSSCRLSDLLKKTTQERAAAWQSLEAHVSQIQAEYDELQKQNTFMMEPMGANGDLDIFLHERHHNLPKALKGELAQDKKYNRLLVKFDDKNFLYENLQTTLKGIPSLRKSVKYQKKAFVRNVIPAMNCLFDHNEDDDLLDLFEDD